MASTLAQPVMSYNDEEISDSSPTISGKKRQRASCEDSTTDPGDKGKGRYACLNHRMKHKRCPPDCKDRRPKPMQQGDLSPASPVISVHSPKHTVVKLEEPICVPSYGLAIPKPTTTLPTHDANPMSTVSALPPFTECSDWDEWQLLLDGQQWATGADNWTVDGSSSSWDSELSLPPSVNPGAPLWQINDVLFGDDAPIGSPDDANSFMHKVSPLVLTRDVVERWLPEPQFNRYAKGCFVRVRIGEYLTSSIYRIARIEEVVDKSFFAYLLGREQTTKGVLLQIGATRKIFSLLSISNKPPTYEEFEHLQTDMAQQMIIVSDEEIHKRAEIARKMDLKYPRQPAQFASSSN